MAERSAVPALFCTTCLSCAHLCATSRVFISESNFIGERCGGCVLQQVGVEVKLLIVLWRGEFSLLVIMIEL